MKTKFKLVLILTLCAAMLTTAGFAAAVDGISVDDTKKEITVFGSPTGVEKGDSVRIQMLKQGVTSGDIDEDYTGDGLLEDFIYITQVPADENGEYSVTISVDGYESGYYVFRVNGEDSEIFYATLADKEEIIDDGDDVVGDDIKSICARPEGEMSTAVSELTELFDLSNPRSVVVSSFVITDEKVFAVTESGLFESFYKLVNASDEELTTNNLNSVLYLAAYITAINEGEGDVIDYIEEFGLEERFVTVYEDRLTTEVKNSFNETYFEGKDYDSTEEISEAFSNAVLTAWCNDFGGWGEIEDYIVEFGEETGVNIDEYNDLSSSEKNDLYEQLLSIGSFEDTDDFASKANTIIGKLSDGGGTGGGNGHGGGGTGSTGSSGTGGGTMGGTTGLPDITPIVPDGGDEPDASGTFNDLSGYEWAQEAIEALAADGIVNGTGEGTYDPASEVKREEILAMLLRAFDVEEQETEETFSDVAADGWYKGVVDTAKALGYVSGRPDGTFGIGDAVTREDVAVMAYNIAAAQGATFDTSVGEAFADDASISSYAKDAVYALKNTGVLSGKGEGQFDPQASCTRAEAAKIIYTLINN